MLRWHQPWVCPDSLGLPPGCCGTGEEGTQADRAVEPPDSLERRGQVEGIPSQGNHQARTEKRAVLSSCHPPLCLPQAASEPSTPESLVSSCALTRSPWVLLSRAP